VAPSAQTDAGGWAAIERIVTNKAGARHIRWSDDAGLYLQATASGFTMARRTVPAADWAGSAIEISLARGMAVTGTVRKSDGTPAAGVRVRGTQPENWGWVEDGHEAVTDSRGSFYLSGFAPGWVSLHAVLIRADAAWVEDAWAEAGCADTEIRLPAEPTRRCIRLLVSGEDGIPVAGARWDAEDDVFSRASRHGWLQDGVLMLPADPDVQWVTIAHPRDTDQAALPWATTVVGPLGARGGDLEVEMPRGFTVFGTVRDEHGKPLKDVLMWAKPLVAVGATERVVSRAQSVSHSDIEGRFRMGGVPPGRVQVEARKEGWSAKPMRFSVPAGLLEFVMHRTPTLRGFVRYPDGSPAPEATVYVHGEKRAEQGWANVVVYQDGHFLISPDGPRAIRLRAGFSPSGVDDMAASEVTVGAGVEAGTIVLTVPRSRGLLVLIPDWPATVAGAARLMNGPYSPGSSEWILGGRVSFNAIDWRAPLSVYCGPLPDGRIAFAPEISPTSKEVTVALVPSRTIRGRACGFPSDAKPASAWADTSAFEARGSVRPDGTFLIHGVPPGGCRVCVLFKRGRDVWAGSVWDAGSAEQVEVELRQKNEADLPAWIYPRPQR
jgi:hypothetical protein